MPSHNDDIGSMSGQAKELFEDIMSNRRADPIDPEEISLSDLFDQIVKGEIETDTAVKSIFVFADRYPKRRGQVFDQVISLLSNDKEDMRITTANALSALSFEYPEYAADHVAPIVDCIDDSSIPVRNYSLLTLTHIADEHPSVMKDYIPTIGELLTSQYPDVRSKAVKIISSIGEEHPEDIVSFVPELVTIFSPNDYRESNVFAGVPPEVKEQLDLIQEQGANKDHRLQQQKQAAMALQSIAEYEPAAIMDHRSVLIEGLHPSEPVQIQQIVLSILSILSEEKPDSILPAVDLIIDVLTERNYPILQASAAQILIVVAEKHTEEIVNAVKPVHPELIKLLNAESEEVRGAVAGLLTYIAEYDPKSLHCATDEIINLLTDEQMHIRGSAIWILRYMKEDNAINALRDIAESDPNPDIRRLANDTIRVLTKESEKESPSDKT